MEAIGRGEKKNGEHPLGYIPINLTADWTDPRAAYD